MNKQSHVVLKIEASASQVTGNAIKYVPAMPLPGNVINVSIQATSLTGGL